MMLVNSAGIVVTKQVSKETQYLLLKSYKYWDFPKGKVEVGETQLEAAKRETFEEARLDDLKFKWGKDVFYETPPYKTKHNKKSCKKVSRYYLAHLNSGNVSLEPNPKTGRLEHDSYSWLTYTEALEVNLTPRIKDVLDWANLTIINSESERNGN